MNLFFIIVGIVYLKSIEVTGFGNLGPQKVLSRIHSRVMKGNSRIKSALLSVIDCKTPDVPFKEQIQTEWAVVDFYADWCGPCKIAAKTFQSVAEEYPDKSVKFIKVDTEVFEDSVDDYGLKGLPVFGVFKGGKLVKKHEGNIGKEKLLEFINSGIQS